MELTVSRDTLLVGLRRVQGIVERRAAMALLSNVLIESVASDRVHITGTNLELFLQGEYDMDVTSPGRVCANARHLFEIVQNLPQGNVRMNTNEDENRLEISMGKRIQYSLPTVDPADYPSVPNADEVEFFNVDRDFMLKMLSYTFFAVAQNDPRAFLNGVHMEKVEDQLRMVATDGHRLAFIEEVLKHQFEIDKPVIVPRKGLAEIRRLLEEEQDGAIELGIKGNLGFFRKEGMILAFRLIEGEFPDYNRVIPQETAIKISVEREPFHAALRRIALLSEERSHSVRFSIQAGLMSIASSNPEYGDGQQELEIGYEGDPLQMKFNARYFLDLLQVASSDKLTLNFNDEMSPCVVRLEGMADYLCVIMPIRA